MQVGSLASVRSSRLVTRSPIYYGWIVLALGTIGAIMSSPGQTYAVSVFIDHLIVDLGISRSLISTLYTIGTLAASFALPFVGRQIDRRGSRLMMAVISVVFGFACIYMGTVSNALMLGVGFLALRMLGQGSLSLVSRNAINQWWVRRRGMAMGIGGMAGALIGGGGYPNVINWLIPVYGWRVTYAILGLSLLLFLAPLSLIFMRNRPEEHGLNPDGARVGGRGKRGVGSPNRGKLDPVRSRTHFCFLADRRRHGRHQYAQHRADLSPLQYLQRQRPERHHGRLGLPPHGCHDGHCAVGGRPAQ